MVGVQHIIGAVVIDCESVNALNKHRYYIYSYRYSFGTSFYKHHKTELPIHSSIAVCGGESSRNAAPSCIRAFVIVFVYERSQNIFRTIKCDEFRPDETFRYRAYI